MLESKRKGWLNSKVTHRQLFFDEYKWATVNIFAAGSQHTTVEK